MKENVCMHGRQGQGKGTFRLVDVTTRPDHKTFDRPHCGFADCVQERARKWKCVSRLRSSMKNHKTWTSMPHVYISMLYFGPLFPRELALQLFRTKTCRALLLTASPRGPSAARGDACGRVAALELRGHLILLRQREQSRRYAAGEA